MAKKKSSRASAELQKLRKQVSSAIRYREKKGLDYGDLRQRVKTMGTRELKRLQSKEGKKSTYKGLERARKKYEKQKQEEKKQFERDEWYRENDGYIMGLEPEDDYGETLVSNLLIELINMLEAPIDDLGRDRSNIAVATSANDDILSLLYQKMAEEGASEVGMRVEEHASEIAELVSRIRESYYPQIMASYQRLSNIINGSSLSLFDRLNIDDEGYWEEPS